jgi:hypothetical protein
MNITLHYTYLQLVTEVKNTWIYAATPHTLHGVVLN